MVNDTQSEPTFDHITIEKLHPTFGVRIFGVDFSTHVSDEVFGEISAAIAKVR